MTDVSNYADTIDSRDITARITELRMNIDLATECGYAFDDLDGVFDMGPDDITEYRELSTLATQGETVRGWHSGVILIRESYFTDHVKEQTIDVMADAGIDFTSWPFNCIDWQEAADEVQSDYTSVEYAGVTFYVQEG